ncbi:MAG: crossover junction endodeoxyribonuclease RuvC [Geminicoccaceae bacterium]|nr:crossover junction endodeoxyribonuclease RuvC [Geminicoccaceae bacterium]MCB2011731.1 crossover junction endodeoxyribonuclease RuvC [Geminicoccaceae bacterium]
MRIIGLDPGLQRTGWGVIEADGPRLRFVACGAVQSTAERALAERLETIFQGLRGVIAGHGPFEAAVEETVVNRNALSSLKLGHARGVVLLAASVSGLVVTEYAAKKVKRSVTGTGNAAKDQVAHMVRMLLPGAGEPTGDAADALAVAICHAHYRMTARQIERRHAGVGA